MSDPNEDKPSYVPEAAWIIIAGYLMIAFGPKTIKMTNALLFLLYKEGYEIHKVNRMTRKCTHDK